MGVRFSLRITQGGVELYNEQLMPGQITPSGLREQTNFRQWALTNTTWGSYWNHQFKLRAADDELDYALTDTEATRNECDFDGYEPITLSDTTSINWTCRDLAPGAIWPTPYYWWHPEHNCMVQWAQGQGFPEPWLNNDYLVFESDELVDDAIIRGLYLNWSESNDNDLAFKPNILQYKLINPQTLKPYNVGSPYQHRFGMTLEHRRYFEQINDPGPPYPAPFDDFSHIDWDNHPIRSHNDFVITDGGLKAICAHSWQRGEIHFGLFTNDITPDSRTTEADIVAWTNVVGWSLTRINNVQDLKTPDDAFLHTEDDYVKASLTLPDDSSEAYTYMSTLQPTDTYNYYGWYLIKDSLLIAAGRFPDAPITVNHVYGTPGPYFYAQARGDAIRIPDDEL